jgi:hypothetical protein
LLHEEMKMVMIIDNPTSREVHEVDVDGRDQLVTPEFTPLAEFAGFGVYEAGAVQETGRGISALINRIPGVISGYLKTRPESATLRLIQCATNAEGGCRRKLFDAVLCR